MKTYGALSIPLLMVFCLFSSNLWAQEAANPPAAPAKLGEAVNPYHAEFVLSEFQDGKTVNTRHFSMNLNAGRKQTIKIGSRVPFESKEGSGTVLQYLDVGTSIDCHLVERENGLGLDVSADVSSMAEHSDPPLIRQFKIESSTIATVGKPVIIGSADVPDSNQQFQLEVTVTKVKF
jgi:hypothetical protein